MKRCPHCNSPITQPDRKTCPVCGKKADKMVVWGIAY